MELILTEKCVCGCLSVDLQANVCFIRQIMHYGCSILMIVSVLVTVLQVVHV